MMDDKQLIKMVRRLKAIKPRNEWVILAKKQVFNEEIEAHTLSIKGILPWFNFRWVLAPIICFSLFFGVFSLSQPSLPGDFLYPVKRVGEKIQSRFVSEAGKPNIQLELADKRIDELARIAETNHVKKLGPALNELETTKVAVKEEVTKLVKNKPEKEAIAIAKGIAVKMEEVNKKESQVLATLGIEAKKKNEPAEKTVVELLIKDAERSSLNESQREHLEKAKEYFAGEEYDQALEEILVLSYPQS